MFAHTPDLTSLITITEESTISRTVHQDDRLKAVLFGFAPGQELSEHTASVPAVLSASPAPWEPPLVSA